MLGNEQGVKRTAGTEGARAAHHVDRVRGESDVEWRHSIHHAPKGGKADDREGVRYKARQSPLKVRQRGREGRRGCGEAAEGECSAGAKREQEAHDRTEAEREEDGLSDALLHLLLVARSCCLGNERSRHRLRRNRGPSSVTALMALFRSIHRHMRMDTGFGGSPAQSLRSKSWWRSTG